MFINEQMSWDDLSDAFAIRAWHQNTNDLTALMAFGA